MKIHYSFDSLAGVRNPVVTTGTFDGVHVGHQVIIKRLNRLAEQHEGESVLITFHPHPRRVLYPEGEGKDLLLICSQEEKKYLLQKTGLDHLLIINFTPEFAKITSGEFVEELLVKKLKSKVIVVGFNHHFGHNRTGDFSYLHSLSEKYSFSVEEIPEQDIQNESVSSTKIRKAILEGNIQRANAYLDHYYLLTAEIEPNPQRSDQFSHPVFNIMIPENIKLIPPDGIYAVNIRNGGQPEKGLISVNRWSITGNVLNPELEIEFCFVNKEFRPKNNKLTFCFHKKIRNGNNPGSNIIQERFQKDIRDIEELIF